MIVFALLILASPQPAACTEAGAHAEARCARRDFAEAERANTVAFDAALARVRGCRPLNSTACYDRNRAIALLDAEQRAWRTWRDAHCDVITFGVEGTSAEEMVRLDCRTGLTAERTRKLEEVGRR